MKQFFFEESYLCNFLLLTALPLESMKNQPTRLFSKYLALDKTLLIFISVVRYSLYAIQIISTANRFGISKISS